MSKDGAELFVRVWQAAKSPDEVAEQLGLTRGNVVQRAAIYRKMGIPLKKLYRGRSPLDVAHLAAVARGEK